MINYPSKAGLFAPTRKIYSKKFKIVIECKQMTIAEAEKEGLVEVFYDRYLNNYSYIVKATGEVVSYFLGFNQSDWPEWLITHRGKQIMHS